MKQFFAKYFVYFPLQFVRKQKVYTYLHEVKNKQLMSLDSIETLRDTKLKSIIAYAYTKVPFYRARFDMASVNPERIMCIRDLVK